MGRPGEEDGVHYHFTTREAVLKEIDDGKFIEHADVHGNIYGTSKAAVNTVIDSGKICILDIDVQGVRSVKGANLTPTPRYVFISPPSQPDKSPLAVLEERLRGRGTEKEEKIKLRLKNAEGELSYGAENDGANFDATIVNASIEKAVDELSQTIDRLSNGRAA